MKKNLIAYSFSHFVVDFICAFSIFSLPHFYPEQVEYMLFYIILYGIIAFAGQAPLGMLCDQWRKPKLFALIGVSLLLIALGLVFVSPLWVVIVVGLGNALFHVGGGVISLQL